MPSLPSLPFEISNPLLHNQPSMNSTDHFPCTGDGDLQAVVRGFSDGFSTTIMDYPQTCFSPLIVEQDDFVFSTFPEFFETNTVLDELEELYKPFYPMLNSLSPQTDLSNSSFSGSGEERESERVQEKEAFSGSSPAAAGGASTTALGVKYKRRKTQHKRVVKEVTAEGLSSDKWAWRKYGQKPIKGSPYPRSYYRCSSLKGCLARKQVERSQLDPHMFVITYTAEHCHGQPTRKSSLAGTTRHKFSLSKTSTAASDPDTPIMSNDSGCSLSPPISSPLLAAKEEEILGLQGMKKESVEEEEVEQEPDGGRENHGLFMCDMLSCDDFLLDFDELDRLTSHLVYN